MVEHVKSIVKILFMAPRMVYCGIINLLWSLMSKMSTDDDDEDEIQRTHKPG